MTEVRYTLWAGLVLSTALFGQTQIHVVRVGPDGRLSPQVTYVKSGDTIRWEGLTRYDSIIPAAGPENYPAICSRRAPYDPSGTNDVTGPMPFAPSGVFTLSPLTAGFSEATSTCPANTQLLLRGDNGKLLCTGGEYEATLDSTWRSDQITGVFVRLLWRDVNPQPGVYDFKVLQREMEQAVKYGKVFSLGVKAGADGTPDWIFSTNPDGTSRPNGGGGVPRLRLQDADDDGAGCGNRMDLGNPARSTYRQHYFNVLTELAKFIKTRTDWYRALAYVKISGANLVSHENRLPNSCATAGQTQCPCNTAIFSMDGYRPSGLYTFYDQQTQLIHDLFPGKAMSYALIQDGFPRISESGAYLNYNGASSDGSALTPAFEQTQTNMDRGQQTWGQSYVVQHNGIGPKPNGCNLDGVHPKPLSALDGYWEVGSGCPNRWAVREGAQGQITGFQTNNRSGVNNPTELDATFQNEWDNSDGVFLEIYEDVFWQAANTNKGVLPRSGKTVGGWAEDLHRRRIDPVFPSYTRAGNPFPDNYSRTFRKTTPGSTPQYVYYVNGSKCGAGNQEWGLIVIDPQPPAIKANGVVSASAFGQFTSVAPGSFIEIYGSNLAVTTRDWVSADFTGVNAPTSLDGTTVRIGGLPAFISYAGPTQVNVQAPSNVAHGPQSLTVTTAAGASTPYTVNVSATQPGLLAPPTFNAAGRQYVVAFFPDGATYVLPPGLIAGVNSRRAKPGDTIVLYGIGFGPVTPDIPAGQIVKQLNTLSLPFQIFFGQTRATVAYSGLAPEYVGLYQFNVVVPNIAASDSVPVTFTLGGVPGAQTLFTAIQN